MHSVNFTRYCVIWCDRWQYRWQLILIPGLSHTQCSTNSYSFSSTQPFPVMMARPSKVGRYCCCLWSSKQCHVAGCLVHVHEALHVYFMTTQMHLDDPEACCLAQFVLSIESQKGLQKRYEIFRQQSILTAEYLKSQVYGSSWTCSGCLNCCTECGP